MATAFTTLPIVDYSALHQPSSKPAELSKLKNAIFDVGFLYLVNTGLESLVAEMHALTPRLFELEQQVKEQVNMRNSPAFLGYTCLGAETTARKTDLREQFDFGTEVEDREVREPWDRLDGQSQFPNHPEAKALIQRYNNAMRTMSSDFVQLVGECLSLPSSTFVDFIGRMDRLKIIRYPPAPAGSQGVGPHKDSSGLFTFLSQDDVGGLQVLNRAGSWIDAPPLEGSFVVNIAQAFEAITGGVCGATTHRVVSPVERTRYSVPYFQSARADLTLEQLKESAASIRAKIPISDDSGKRAVDVPSEFLSPLYACFGEAQLRNRILSHPDVGKRWYPELYEKYFNRDS